MRIVITSFTLSLALIGAASVTRAQEPQLAPALEASAPVVPSAGAQLAETPAGLDTSPAGTRDALGDTAGAGPFVLADGVAMGSLSVSSPAGRPDASTAGEGTVGGGTHWGPLLKQSFALLAAQQVYRAAFEDGTWEETKRGIFWDDYFDSAKTLCCWDDGDKGTTNYLFHPLMGSAAAFVFANNHDPSQRTPLGNTRQYWSNKTKAMAYAAAYSAYFELGPLLSEAAIGNVGLTPGQQTWVDFVITPTVGTAFSIGEDLLRVHVIDKVDRRSHAWGIPLALLLNPTRSVANAFAGKVPWSAPPGLSRRAKD